MRELFTEMNEDESRFLQILDQIESGAVDRGIVVKSFRESKKYQDTLTLYTSGDKFKISDVLRKRAYKAEQLLIKTSKAISQMANYLNVPEKLSGQDDNSK